MQVRAVFYRLGFDEEARGVTDVSPAFAYDFGNMRLTAAEVMNRHFRPVFYCGGVWSDARTIALVEFELPLEVDTFEQGVALIAHLVGREFRPQRETPWLEYGRSLTSELPWEREQAAYRARVKTQ